MAVPLEPLDPDAARELVQRLLGSSVNGEAAVQIADLADTSEGNPLFIEQLAAALVERSATGTSLPTTIRGIVAARLDALPSAERSVLLAASVSGRVFWSGLLARAVDPETLPAVLGALESRDLIRRDSVSLIKDEQQYAFTHALIRDAAYETLPRTKRQEMHTEVAEFLEQEVSPEGESAAVLARHWRAAGQPERAVGYLVSAAEQAGRGWAKAQAFALYGEALACVPADQVDLIRRLKGQQAIAFQASVHVRDAQHLGRGADVGARLAREVGRRDVAGDLMDLVDVVPAELGRVLDDGVLVRRSVDAERADPAVVIDDDVAVLPGDLREVLGGDLLGLPAYFGHVLFLDEERALDQVSRHAAPPRQGVG